MNILRYIVIAFSLWYLPGFIFEIVGSSAGSNSSYLMFLFILAYFFLAPKVKPRFALLLLGITYFMIAGLEYSGKFDLYAFKFVKYIIFIVGLSELVTRCKVIHVFYFLLIGAGSIIINAALFPDNYGRYSGFYFNPNLAALLAAIGFCISFKISNRLLRAIGFIAFILAGFLTFSRYFILMWILLTLISVIMDRKNAEALGIGLGTGILVLAIASLLQLNTQRLTAVEKILGNQVSQGTSTLKEGSREETWALFYDDVMDNIYFGNGYMAMSGGVNRDKVGAHNSLLLVVGEAGIIPFFIMLFIFGRMLYLGLKKIKEELFIGLLCLVLCSYIFVSHNFFDNYLFLFIILWFLYYLEKPTEEGMPEVESN